MSHYEIINIESGDFYKCVQVIRAAFATVAAQFGLTTENCPTNAAFITEDRLIYDKSKGNSMFALAADGEIVGFMQLEKKDDGRFELKNIAVVPEHRHNGCGKMLLDVAKAKVRELGGSKISIGIIEENTVLKNWYTANGFVHMGTKKFEHLPFTVGFMETAV